MSEVLHIPPEFDEAAVVPPVDYEATSAQLKIDIEGLAERVMYSRAALTARLTQHTVFVNGLVKTEGVEMVLGSSRTPSELAEMTLMAVLALRNQHRGPVDLIWRVEPEFREQDGNVDLYVRLCFEPSLTQVAAGVWVEKRMAELTPFGTWAHV